MHTPGSRAPDVLSPVGSQHRWTARCGKLTATRIRRRGRSCLPSLERLCPCQGFGSYDALFDIIFFYGKVHFGQNVFDYFHYLRFIDTCWTDLFGCRVPLKIAAALQDYQTQDNYMGP